MPPSRVMPIAPGETSRHTLSRPPAHARQHAAAEQLVDRHDGCPLRSRHALAERDDLADDLVAERDRQREPVAAAAQQVDVRPADAGRQHAKQHLARSRLGARQVDDLRLPCADQAIGAHRSRGG